MLYKNKIKCKNYSNRTLAGDWCPSQSVSWRVDAVHLERTYLRLVDLGRLVRQRHHFAPTPPAQVVMACSSGKLVMAMQLWGRSCCFKRYSLPRRDKLAELVEIHDSPETCANGLDWILLALKGWHLLSLIKIKFSQTYVTKPSSYVC